MSFENGHRTIIKIFKRLVSGSFHFSFADAAHSVSPLAGLLFYLYNLSATDHLCGTISLQSLSSAAFFPVYNLAAPYLFSQSHLIAIYIFSTSLF